jgi:hypothetical protein
MTPHELAVTQSAITVDIVSNCLPIIRASNEFAPKMGCLVGKWMGEILNEVVEQLHEVVPPNLRQQVLDFTFEH